MFKALSPSFLMVALISHACKLYFDLGICNATCFDPFPPGGGSYSPFPSSLGGPDNIGSDIVGIPRLDHKAV